MTAAHRREQTKDVILIQPRKFLPLFSSLTALALASVLRADEQTPFKLPLDELLATPINTAAKYDQTLSSVAASVTVITSDEIERYGWTSLPEVLESIPGFYVTYDRNYTYIGVRGIGRPSDYNTRILVLRDGLALDGEIFGGAPMPEIDPYTIERIEIVRGPGSALYGSHAMLAVVNIITKSSDAIDGVGASATYGSLGKMGGTVRMGKTLPGGLRITASGMWQKRRGADLYFPDFDSPATNHGVAKGRDYEDSHELMFAVEKGKFRLTGYTGSRTKGIPTASYGTAFNAASSTIDRDNSLAARYELPLGVGKTLELRGGYERSRARGFYPYDSLGIDNSLSTRYRGEARFNWDVRPNQRLTAGMEVSRVSEAEYNYTVGDYRIRLLRPFIGTSLYVQDEYHPSTTLGIVAGVRYDRAPFTRSSTSPRAAVLYTPSRSTTIKLLYGTAFRTPSLYESEFEDPLTPWKDNAALKPETIRTTELVLEQRVSPAVFVVGSLFRVGASNLINGQIDPTDSVGWYQNIGSLKSTGGEMSVELRRENGLWGHLGVSTQTATDGRDPISNSPRTTIKGGVSSSPASPWHGGLEAIYESSRLTRDGATTASSLLLNAVLTRNLGAGLRIGVTIRNLLDTRYSTPVGPELLPQSIVQDGRSVALKLSYSR
jgi:outer membrane receptor protein involved in Fe transport